jgi:hypothetical protein
VFIWITDANYHEKDGFTSRSRQDVIARLLSLDVTVQVIGAAMYQTDWYTPFTQATGGNFYNITGNFRDILLDIGNLHGSTRYLFSYTSPATQGQTKQIILTVHYAGLGGTSFVSYASPSTSIAAPALACFPNPFNPQTTIRMEIPAGTHGTVSIYNVLGQQVRTYVLAGAAGTTEIAWNAKDDGGRDVATGCYLVRFALYSTVERLISSDVAKILYVK